MNTEQEAIKMLRVKLSKYLSYNRGIRKYVTIEDRIIDQVDDLTGEKLRIPYMKVSVVSTLDKSQEEVRYYFNRASTLDILQSHWNRYDEARRKIIIGIRKEMLKYNILKKEL